MEHEQRPEPTGVQRQDLPPRTLEVLELAADYKGNKVIAAELSVSIKTVENHLTKAGEHFGTNTKSDTVREFRRRYPDFGKNEWGINELDLDRELTEVQMRELWSQMPHTARNPNKDLAVFDDKHGPAGRLIAIFGVAFGALVLVILASVAASSVDRHVENVSSSPL